MTANKKLETRLTQFYNDVDGIKTGSKCIIDVIFPAEILFLFLDIGLIRP